MATEDDSPDEVSNSNAHLQEESEQQEEIGGQLNTRDVEIITQFPETKPELQEILPPPEHQEQVGNIDTFVGETEKEEEKLSESNSVRFMNTDEQILTLETDRSSLTFDTGAQKLNLGNFPTLALKDVDGSLHLPEGELEQLVKRSPVGKRALARVEERDNVLVERGRLRIHNVGGSLTFLLQIALLAWGIRQLRSVLAKRRQKQAPRINTEPFRPSDPPPFSTLSALALKKLVERIPTSHLLIDVRFLEAVQASPFPLKNIVNIPEGEIRIVFQLSEAEWASRFSFVKSPDRSQLIVFLSTKGRRAQRAAIIAAELGYNGCCVLSGGIAAFRALSRDGEQFEPAFLSRDAVAVLLQNVKYNPGRNITSPKPFLIDVRRHDERALYGHIYGSTHVPGRTNNRSSWGAQVAHDAGVNWCFVCKGGVLGWHLDANVLPYDGYALGNPPPEPHKFEVDTVNYDAAEQELQELDLHQTS